MGSFRGFCSRLIFCQTGSYTGRPTAATAMQDLMTLVTLITLLIGCTPVNTPIADDLASLENPPPAVQEKIEQLLPVVLEWYTRTEQQLLPLGRSLSPAEQELASTLGVKAPEQVRVVVLETFPLPDDEVLLQEAIRYGFGSTREVGRTQGYVIMLKPGHQQSAAILSHELVHVAQHDRMGREAFLRRYLTELITLGYERSPLELEAYSRQLRND